MILGVLFQNPVRSSLHPVGQCIQGVIDDLLLADVYKRQSLILRKGFEITDEEVINKIGLPCFIKPNAGGCLLYTSRCV